MGGWRTAPKRVGHGVYLNNRNRNFFKCKLLFDYYKFSISHFNLFWVSEGR